MKKQSTLLLLFLFCACFHVAQGQEVQTIETSDFEQNGSQLTISFDIPYQTTTLTYNISSVYVIAGGENVEVRTYTGNRENLKSGEAYQIVWDVFEDVFQLESPEVARITLEYTSEARRIAEKLEEQKQKEAEAKQERAERLQRKRDRRNNKPFTFGVLGFGGITHGIFEGTDPDLESRLGIGYGVGAQLEFRLQEGTYLQIEGAYMTRDLSYSNTGDNTDYFYNNQVFWDIEKAKISLVDYRAYAKVKFSSYIQVGGYFALTQSATRSGELEYEVFYPDGTYDQVQVGDFEAEYLEKAFEDNNGATPISKIDYGLTFGIESPTKSNLILGLGYDLSLANLLNQEYDSFRTFDELYEIYPVQDSEVKLGFAYLRIGVRF